MTLEQMRDIITAYDELTEAAITAVKLIHDRDMHEWYSESIVDIDESNTKITIDEGRIIVSWIEKNGDFAFERKVTMPGELAPMLFDVDAMTTWLDAKNIELMAARREKRKQAAAARAKEAADWEMAIYLRKKAEIEAARAAGQSVAT